MFARSSFAGLSVALVSGAAIVAAQGPLLVGGSRANFAVLPLSSGFEPDPVQVMVVSGGTVGIASLDLGAHCGGWVTPQPDVIVHYANAGPFLRFDVHASGVTLVVHDPNGRWICDDGSDGELHAELSSPASGAYDVWIGSDHLGARTRGTLLISERP